MFNYIEKFRSHGRHIWLSALVAGFVFDFFTLWRIDLWQEELIFAIYIVVAGACIAYLTLVRAEPPEQGRPLRAVLPMLALQFTFGGLLGRFFIF